MTMTLDAPAKPASKPKAKAKTIRVFYDYSQRRLGFQTFNGEKYGKARYVPSIGLRDVTTSIENDGNIDGQHVGFGGFLHGKMLDKSSVIRLNRAVAIHWNGHQFVTANGQTVKSAKMMFVIDNTILGYGVVSE